jgi:hypothetical protein
VRRLLPLLVLLLACSSPEQTTSNPETAAPASSPTASSEPSRAAPGTVPPPWLGTRVLPVTESGYGEVRPTPRALRQRRFTLPDSVPALPGRRFAARITDPAPRAVIARSTWQRGCPVDRDELAWVRVAFRGFDGARHTGELLVASSVASDVRAVFRDLWRARFPIEQMRITTRDELDLPPTGDGNGTESFVCRPTVGASYFSQHAYGTAIDVNAFQNPYLKGDVVLPELASSYLDRTWRRPGMVLADGPVTRAFARIGWAWGGAWSSLKDYQHFSANGR